VRVCARGFLRCCISAVAAHLFLSKNIRSLRVVVPVTPHFSFCPVLLCLCLAVFPLRRFIFQILSGPSHERSTIKTKKTQKINQQTCLWISTSILAAGEETRTTVLNFKCFLKSVFESFNLRVSSLKKDYHRIIDNWYPFFFL
jgi:hypothetical protein